jgi:hypothetical protein
MIWSLLIYKQIAVKRCASFLKRNCIEAIGNLIYGAKKNTAAITLQAAPKKVLIPQIYSSIQRFCSLDMTEEDRVTTKGIQKTESSSLPPIA